MGAQRERDRERDRSVGVRESFGYEGRKAKGPSKERERGSQRATEGCRRAKRKWRARECSGEGKKYMRASEVERKRQKGQLKFPLIVP